MSAAEDFIFEPLVGARYYETGDDVFCYAIESYDEVIDDIKPLLHDHWDELAAYKDIPLKPNFAFYKAADAMKAIRIYTARKNGDLIGYIIMSLARAHPHYMDQPWAVSDIVLVVKEHRTFGVGNALFDFMEADMEGFVVSVGVKNAHPELRFLLESRGYLAVETLMQKRL